MRLSEFILNHLEAILVEWEAFAATLLPAAGELTPLALRDHAQPILEAIARDLMTSQTREEQTEKSQGRAIVAAEAPETAAQTHAVLRAQAGFDINQLIAEYRALRASILRLWADDSPLDQSDIEDMIRFNEAIDQAIAESVGHFDARVERSRNLLLGMLGHDLRSPLQSIQMTASFLSALNAGEMVDAAADRLIRSGASMQALLDDLVDFNRTRLGLGIKVRPENIDLAAVVADEVDQFQGAHQDCRIDVTVTGDCRGQCDRLRLQQLIRNLLSNAVRYGAPDTPIRVALRGEESVIHLEVGNRGSAIDPAELCDIFNPLKRGAARGDRNDPGSLGLGLYIVREITHAHGGEVDVQSDDSETRFTVDLPRQHLAPD